MARSGVASSAKGFFLSSGAAGASGCAMEYAGESASEIVSTGFRSLDGLLPAGGVQRGRLLEWLSADALSAEDVSNASGAVTLAFAVACHLAGSSPKTVGSHASETMLASTIVVVDRQGWFHPPAVMPWLAGRQLLVARPSRDDDESWTIDQCLRCPGVAAVVAWPKRIHPTSLRRWQLAARRSQAVGMLVRPEAARREPSWAEARIAVAPLPSLGIGTRRLRLGLAGGPWSGDESVSDRSVEIAIDLVRGCEAPCGTASRGIGARGETTSHRERMATGRRRDESLQIVQLEGLACRAS